MSKALLIKGSPIFPSEINNMIYTLCKLLSKRFFLDRIHFHSDSLCLCDCYYYNDGKRYKFNSICWCSKIHKYTYSQIINTKHLCCVCDHTFPNQIFKTSEIINGKFEPTYYSSQSVIRLYFKHDHSAHQHVGYMKYYNLMVHDKHNQYIQYLYFHNECYRKLIYG